MTVSATHDASEAATAASAARPAGLEDLHPGLDRGRMARRDGPAGNLAQRPGRSRRTVATLRPVRAPAVRVLPCAARWGCGVIYDGGAMTLTKEEKLEIVGKHGKHDRTRAPPRCRSRCSPSASTSSPTTCGRTRRTITRGGLLKLVGRRRRFLTISRRTTSRAIAP